MTREKLMLDTNILIDYLNKREPFYQQARLLMIVGKVGEFELWMSSSQATDLIYILSGGGKESAMDRVLAQIRGLRTFINVCAATDREVDNMLAATWSDPEDELLFEMALKIHADAIITRDANHFETDAIKVMNCDEFFAWLQEEQGISYAEIEV